MKRFLLAMAVIVAIALPSQAPAASLISLQNLSFNVNGTYYNNVNPPSGVNDAGFDYNTGLGTFVYTFNPGAPGSFFFDVLYDIENSVPFYNEFGLASGTPAAGMTWQIDEPTGSADANRTGTLIANAMSNSYDGINHIPGSTSNYSNNCGADGGGAINHACNNDVGMGLGFNFNLPAGDQAVITLTTSTTQPTSGFYLEQIHPIDPDNPTATDVFLQGSIAIGPAGGPPPTVPEPGSLVLLATGFAGLAMGSLRKKLQGKTTI